MDITEIFAMLAVMWDCDNIYRTRPTRPTCPTSPNKKATTNEN